jgi:DNA-binding LacI/PurR family transcriptional regulator
MLRNLKMKKKNMPPTFTEVARPAGVGTTTVSRVINVAITLKNSTRIFVFEVVQKLRIRIPNSIVLDRAQCLIAVLLND